MLATFVSNQAYVIQIVVKHFQFSWGGITLIGHGHCSGERNGSNHPLPPQPYLVHISHPLTSTTNSSETGRNTFQPSRISWS